MRLIKFYNRLNNQYKIHRRWASVWTIIRLARAQSKDKKIEMIGIVVDRPVIPMIDIDIDTVFDDTINSA